MDITIYPYGTNGELPTSIGLVNDLTTGGVDKALTAEQGKVLRNYTIVVQEIDIDSYPILPYVISSSTLNWSSNASSTINQHIAVPITEGGTYRISPGSNGVNDYAWLTTDEVGHNIGGTSAPVVQGTSIYYVSREKDIVAPIGAKYLYIRVSYDSSVNYLPSFLGECLNINEIVKENGLSFVEQTIKPYVNTAAWVNFDGVNLTYAVTQSNSGKTTGGFIYKIRSKECKIRIQANLNLDSYYCLLKSFTEPSDGSPVDIVSGGIRNIVTRGTMSSWINIPNDCNYLYIGIYNANGTVYSPIDVSFRYSVDDWINSGLSYKEYKTPYYYIGNKLKLKDFDLEPKKAYTTKTVYVPNIGYWDNTTNYAQQSLAIYGGYIFLFYHSGYCKILDVNTFEVLYSFQLGSPISHSNNHCGNACFSEQFFDESDEFPLLYISNHLQNGECYVCRIVRNSSGGFSTESITLVQMIKSAQGETNREYHFYPHKDQLICHAGTRYNIYPLPTVNTNEVETYYLDTSTIISTFDTPISGHTAAGQEARNGRIFCLWYRGADSVPRYDLLTIYNFETGEYDAQINLPNRLAVQELEGIDIYDGKIYIGYNVANQIGVIDFD
jgi:hypothetical protein